MNKNVLNGFLNGVFELRIMLQTIQIILVILKLSDIMTCSWFLICIPMYIHLFMMLVLTVLWLIESNRVKKQEYKKEKEIERPHGYEDIIKNK